jgi:hypothetical protein
MPWFRLSRRWSVQYLLACALYGDNKLVESLQVHYQLLRQIDTCPDVDLADSVDRETCGLFGVLPVGRH